MMMNRWIGKGGKTNYSFPVHNHIGKESEELGKHFLTSYPLKTCFLPQDLRSVFLPADTLVSAKNSR